MNAPAHPLKPSLPALDGLRLLASLNIVLLHAEASGGLNALGGKGWFFVPIKTPLFSASMFFVLGGFLYTWLHLSKGRTPELGPLLRKRLLRLLPLHISTTILMAFLVAVRTDTPPWDLVRAVFWHLSLLWPWAPEVSHDLNYPSWAIAAFLACYLMFPTFYRALVTETRRAYFLGTIALCLGLLFIWGYTYHIFPPMEGRYRFFHSFPLARIPEFLIGAVLARWLHSVPVWKHRWYPTALALGVLALLHYSQFSWGGGELLHWTKAHTLRPLLYGLLIVAIARGSGPFHSLLAWHPLRALGRGSFYPYLLHIPLMTAISSYCDYAGTCKAWLHSPWNILWFCLVLYVPSALFTAWQSRRSLSGNS